MSESLVQVLLVCVLLMLGFRAVTRYQAHGRRMQQLSALCSSRGWVLSHPVRSATFSWSASRTPVMVGDVSREWLESLGVPLLRMGRDYPFPEVVAGECSGSPFRAFTHKYVTRSSSRVGSGRVGSTTSHFHQVVLLPIPTVGPLVSLHPEGVISRMMDAVTGADIDFEDEEFNRQFRIRCDDRRFAYAVVSPQVMELLKTLQPTELHWASGCLVWVARGHLQSDTLERVLPQLQMLAAVITQDAGHHPPGGVV